MPQQPPLLQWSAHHVQRIDAPQGLRVQVLQGRLWLTRTGLHQDIFVDAGHSQSLLGHGWVLEAEETSQLRLLPMAPAHPRWMGWVPRWRLRPV